MPLSAFLKKSVWDEKLRNPLGAGVLLLFGLGFAWLVSTQGLVPGLLLIAALVGIPAVYGTVAYPKLGIVILLMAAFLLFFILRLGLDFPVGTVVDGIEWLLVLGMYLSLRRRQGKSILDNPIAVTVLIWMAYTLLQVINPWAESQMAWLYTVRTVGAVTLMYFVFVSQIDSLPYLRGLIWLWLALALVGALYGFKQEFIGFSPAEFQQMLSDPKTVELLFINGHWRKYSIFSDPVAFAYNMVMAAFICVCLLRVSKGFFRKLILLTITVCCIFSMLFAGTRGAYVLIPAGFVMFFLLRFSRSLLVLAGVAAVGFGVLINIPTSNPTLYRFQTAFRPTDDPSFNLRTYNQKLIQPYIQQNPIGGGLGATGVWGQRFAPDSYLANFPPDSGYVRVAVEMGWLGMLLFCCLIFIILKTGIDHFFMLRNAELKAYCLAMTIVVFVLGIGSYPQEAFVQYPSNILFYLAAAIIQVSLQLEAAVEKPEPRADERGGDLNHANAGAAVARNASSTVL